MLCPVCLHRARVIDTRHPRRRYHCESCDLRWSTMEGLVPHSLRPPRRPPRRPKPKRKDPRPWLEKIQAKLSEP
jgi:hypothetical protein